MKETIKNEILKRYEILFEQGLTTDAKDWVRDGKRPDQQHITKQVPIRQDGIVGHNIHAQ